MALRPVDLLPLWGLLLQAVQPGVPQGDGAAAVQGHNGHGRVIQHGLDPPLGGVHCFGDSPGNLRHGQAVIRVPKFGIDLRQLRLSGGHSGAGVFQARRKFSSCHVISAPSFDKINKFWKTSLF